MNKILFAVVAIAVIGLVGFYAVNKPKNNADVAQDTSKMVVEDANTNTTTTTNDAPAVNETADTADSEAADLEDGTYTEIGNYTSPNGKEEVEVTLTLKDGVVTEAEFVGKATHKISVTMQGKFNEGYKELVVGKSIADIEMDIVNGSSLTPKGFLDAVEKIEADAQAS